MYDGGNKVGIFVPNYRVVLFALLLLWSCHQMTRLTSPLLEAVESLPLSPISMESAV